MLSPHVAALAKHMIDKPAPDLSRLLLAPSPVTGLDEYLSSNMYMPVETLDLASVFDFSRTPELADPAQQARFFLPLGAALRTEAAA